MLASDEKRLERVLPVGEFRKKGKLQERDSRHHAQEVSLQSLPLELRKVMENGVPQAELWHEVATFLFRIIPTSDPFKALKICTPTPELEKPFMASFNATVERYRVLADRDSTVQVFERQQVRQFGFFFLGGIRWDWRVQVLIVCQDIPAKLRRHLGELMVWQLSQQLRVGFVGSFVLAGEVGYVDLETLVLQLRVAGIRVWQQVESNTAKALNIRRPACTLLSGTPEAGRAARTSMEDGMSLQTLRKRKQLTTEAEYFHRLDVELLDQMRKRAAFEEERLQLAEQSHIKDQAILDALAQVGFNLGNVMLLDLVPLIQVALGESCRADSYREGGPFPRNRRGRRRRPTIVVVA
jgi:hypothetical protein